MNEKQGEGRRVIVERTINQHEVHRVVRALAELHLEFDIEKRYIDYKDYVRRGAPPDVVGVARYTIRVYDPAGDDRTRHEVYHDWLMPILKPVEVADEEGDWEVLDERENT